MDGTNVYKQPPQNVKSKKINRKAGRDDDDDEEEDVQYLNMKDLRKKKPMPAAQPKELSAEMLEKRKK